MNLNLPTHQFTLSQDVQIPATYYTRPKTTLKILDDFLCTSLAPGCMFTLAAEPGAGKTTFLLQVLGLLTVQKHRTGISSGEEAIERLANNCRRLSLQNISIATITDVDVLCQSMAQLDILIIDSFQTLKVTSNQSSLKKANYCIEAIREAATRTNCIVGMICHVTKQGSPRGTTTLLHAADLNMSMRISPDNNSHRIIKIDKNRFGSTSKIICEITSTGFKFIDPNALVPLATSHPKLWKSAEHFRLRMAIGKIPPYRL